MLPSNGVNAHARSGASRSVVLWCDRYQVHVELLGSWVCVSRLLQNINLRLELFPFHTVAGPEGAMSRTSRNSAYSRVQSPVYAYE